MFNFPCFVKGLHRSCSDRWKAGRGTWALNWSATLLLNLVVGTTSLCNRYYVLCTIVVITPSSPTDYIGCTWDLPWFPSSPTDISLQKRNQCIRYVCTPCSVGDCLRRLQCCLWVKSERSSSTINVHTMYVLYVCILIGTPFNAASHCQKLCLTPWLCLSGRPFPGRQTGRTSICTYTLVSSTLSLLGTSIDTYLYIYNIRICVRSFP